MMRLLRVIYREFRDYKSNLHKIISYWRSHGLFALVFAIKNKIRRDIAAQDIYSHKNNPVEIDISSSGGREASCNKVIEERFCFLKPLRIFYVENPTSFYINVVTDSVSKGSLFGGVGTALIFASMFANSVGARLRVITRTEPIDPENIYKLLALYKIELKTEPQFKFAPHYDSKYQIDITDKDFFITTSWWSTASTIPGVNNKRIIYLLQEDERMFYPFGDDRQRAEDVMKNPHINFLINTQLLYEHFVNEDFKNIEVNGKWFEPAFPSSIYHRVEKAGKEKRKFFFYARPNNLRNLFYLGLEVIEDALLKKIIDLDEWEVFLVGKDIPAITFECGYKPKVLENLTWSDYAAMLGEVDLGLTLMSTPHPSYPPLDLAASGSVVVTNKFMNKKSLSNYSANIICAGASKPELVEALRKGISLALDERLRKKNYSENGLRDDWGDSFYDVLNGLKELNDV